MTVDVKIELCAVCVLHVHFFFHFKLSDHEVYQSAGAGSADRHRGEGPLYLGDCSGKRRFYYKREGAEQRWVPGIRSVANFKKQVDFANYHSSIIISNRVWFVYSRGNCGPKADCQHSGIHWRDQFPERSGGCGQVLQKRILMQHAYYFWQRMKSMLNIQ